MQNISEKNKQALLQEDGFEVCGDAFLDMVKKHMGKYPLMKPQDYGKLIFQGEFGPEHMISDKAAAKRYLLEEWEGMEQIVQSPVSMSDMRKNSNNIWQMAEEIGGNMCRFPLSACLSAEAAELLAELFVLTAKGSDLDEIQKLEIIKKKKEIIQTKLKLLDCFGIPGMEQWAASWVEQGCPPVHHSDAYREAYQPHYRLLRKEYAGYFPVLLDIKECLMKAEKENLLDGEKNPPVIIGIDGRCGSGKTSLAELISQLFSCPVFHMDDYYLPFDKRPEDWRKLPGGNMDFSRFREEVLLPAASGETVLYRPYHCATGTFGKTEEISPGRLFVVEGSYSHHPLLSVQDGSKTFSEETFTGKIFLRKIFHGNIFLRRIFLTCAESEQKERLKKREGSYFHAFEEQWIPMEENYFKQYEIEKNSDYIIDTSEFYKVNEPNG